MQRNEMNEQEKSAALKRKDRKGGDLVEVREQGESNATTTTAGPKRSSTGLMASTIKRTILLDPGIIRALLGPSWPFHDDCKGMRGNHQLIESILASANRQAPITD